MNARTTAVALLGVLLLLAGCATTPSGTRGSIDAAQAAQRQILLTVHQPESLALGLTGAPGQRYQQRRYGPTPSVERILSQIAREQKLERVDGWAIGSLSVYCEVFAVPADRSVEDVIRTLSADPRVDLVQRMNVFDTQTSRYDDPYVDLQSAAIQLDVEDAHLLATGRGVSIAIIDSAIDGDHPDLRGRVRFTRDLVDTHHFHDGEVHGTAIAGIIASAVNNREGIVGVAPDVSIAALRACWAVEANGIAAKCSSFSLARALEIAVELHPNVVNLSLAGPADALLSRLLDELIDRGIIVVTAQPESNVAATPFPSAHPKVLAAHSAADAVVVGSRFTLGAPATEILTTTPGARYEFLTGNSLAAAHMAGVVALLMERDPTLDADHVATLLSDTSNNEPGNESINACRALERLTGTPICTHGGVELARF